MASTEINIEVRDIYNFRVSQVIICQARWSVKKLKKHLHQVLPCKPEPRCQNLIYVGHLLKNSSKLINIFPTNGEKPIKVYLVTISSKSAKRKASKKLNRIKLARHFDVKDATTSTNEIDEIDEQDLLCETAAREVFDMTGLAERIVRNPNDEMLRIIYQTYLDQVFFHMEIGNNSISEIIRPYVEDIFNDVDEGEVLEGNYCDDEWVDLGEPTVKTKTKTLAQAQTQTESETQAQPQSQALSHTQAQPQSQAQTQPPNQARAPLRNLAEAEANAQPQNLAEAQAQENQVEEINDPEEEADWLDWLHLGLRVFSLVVLAHANATFLQSLTALLILIVISLLPNLVALELQRRAHFNLPRLEIPPDADWLTRLKATFALFILSLLPDLIE